MMLGLTLPDWLPWWVPLGIAVLGGLYAMAFLAMPFGVFGLKGRLDGIEMRLDEIQGEIRMLALRLPERSGADYERPPIPPARATPILRQAANVSVAAEARRRVGPPPPSRAEPSFDPY